MTPTDVLGWLQHGFIVHQAILYDQVQAKVRAAPVLQRRDPVWYPAELHRIRQATQAFPTLTTGALTHPSAEKKITLTYDEAVWNLLGPSEDGKVRESALTERATSWLRHLGFGMILNEFPLQLAPMASPKEGEKKRSMPDLLAGEGPEFIRRLVMCTVFYYTKKYHPLSHVEVYTYQLHFEDNLITSQEDLLWQVVLEYAARQLGVIMQHKAGQNIHLVLKFHRGDNPVFEPVKPVVGGPIFRHIYHIAAMKSPEYDAPFFPSWRPMLTACHEALKQLMQKKK